MYRIRNGRNVRWTITECAYGTRPGNSATCTCPVVDRSQLRSNGHQQIHTWYLQDALRMRNGQTTREPDTPHTNGWVTFTHRTYLSGGVGRSFEQVQNLPTDKTGQNGYHLTRNAFTHRMGNGREETHANGHERTEILLSVTRPLVLSGKVRESLKGIHLYRLDSCVCLFKPYTPHMFKLCDQYQNFMS